jgi:hypothetical protein
MAELVSARDRREDRGAIDRLGDLAGAAKGSLVPNVRL